MKTIKINTKNTSAIIDLEDGMNVISLERNGIECIICDLERKKNGGTYAIPILFPTPNRTKDNHFVYNGEEVATVMHGYSRHSEFTLIEQTENSVTAKSDFKDSEYAHYNASMTVKISLYNDTLRWDFDIKNNDTKPFPYSIALHPFFIKSLFDSVKSDCQERMLTDDALIPTGKCVKLDENESFLKPRDINTIKLDTVFLSDKAIESTLIGKEFSLSIKGSDEFRHVVIYTSPEKPFICIEPQTGSTDFVNLDAHGFNREANLLELKEGASAHSLVEFKFV